MKFKFLMPAMFIALTALQIFAQIPLYAQTIENVQTFGSEPAAHETGEGRTLTNCLANFRQFIAAGIGYEDFSDYWRDFFLWPSHYADVSNIQNQLNKARYAVVASFLRCDLDRLNAVTSSYYRLEAELYFLRHYVDTKGGFLRILTENPKSKQKFADEMVKYMILLKPAPDEEKERLLYGGYFDLFEAKYRDRAKTYADFGSDPVYGELIAKFTELADTFKSFRKLGSELGKLGNEAIVEPAKAIGGGAKELFTNPESAIKDAAGWVGKKFDACVETPDSRYCFNSANREGEGDEDPFALPTVESGKTKRTFGQVLFSIKQQELKKTEDLTEAEILARYELLYGQMAGSGTKAIQDELNRMIKILGAGRKEEPVIPGTLDSLEALGRCSEEVVSRTCK